MVLEGIDASGTTTQLERLGEALRARGRDVVQSHEPTNRAIGRQIRAWLAADAEAPPPDAIALLFAADRLDHVHNVVRPAVERGAIVLCDRYLMSSYAYQGLDCPADWVRAINRRAPWPDLTLWIDVPVEVALARARARLAANEAKAERFDGEALQRKLDRAYRDMAADPELGVVRIDGTLEIPQVTESLLTACTRIGL